MNIIIESMPADNNRQKTAPVKKLDKGSVL